MSVSSVDRGQRLLNVMACIALVVGLAATLYGFFSLDGFSEDEFFQLAFMNEGWMHFLVQVARLDQHPPFHPLQLKLWGLIFSSDKGLLLNSVVWHIVACWVIFWAGRERLGTTAGLLAVAFYATIPQVITASVSLRMYSMIPALAVAAWWLNVKLLLSSDKGWGRWLILAAIELALAYSHAIAFFFVAWICLAAAVQVFSERRKEACWRQWFTVQTVIAVLLLPLVISALVRVTMPGQAETGGNNNPGNLVTHLGGMIAGWGNKSDLARLLGASFYSFAVAIGLWCRLTRPMAAVMLIGPYLTASIVALVLAPMFKTPVYSAMLVPFACLVLAGGLMALKGSLGKWSGAILLVGLAVTVIPASQKLLASVSPYKPIVAELKRRVLPGDVVVIAKPYLYWAVMRYAVAPNWGSPLEVLPALTDNWKRMIGKLGPDVADALKLNPRTDHVVHAGVTYVIGGDAVRDSTRANRVWIIQRIVYPLPVQLAEGFVDRGVVAQYGDRETTQLKLFERQ